MKLWGQSNKTTQKEMYRKPIKIYAKIIYDKSNPSCDTIDGLPFCSKKGLWLLLILMAYEKVQ